MRGFSSAPVGAAAERAEVARRRHGPGADGELRFTIPVDARQSDLARHLEESAMRARSMYAAGQHHPWTEQIVVVAEQLGAAVADTPPNEPVRLQVRLDREQSNRFRKYLLASRERAGDSRGIGEAIGRIVSTWERLMKWRQEMDEADAARPPREAMDEGGWRQV